MAENIMNDPSLPRTSGESRARRIISLSVRYLVPLALTVLLVMVMFREVKFSEMMEILRSGVNYWWILLAMGISVLSHIFRAARWRLQLRGLGIDPPFMALCCSVFGCYALNLVFPRLGEVWRCTYIAGREKAPFSTVIGSMVADRLSDTLTVLLLVLLTFVVASPALNAFLVKYPVGRDLVALLYNPWFWICCLGAVALVWGLFRIFRETGAVRAVTKFGRQLWEGFAVVVRMKGRGMFVFLTLCIWTCYFVQLYVAFYAFPFTEELCHREGTCFGLIPCLVAFVLSSIGMAVPSNGGLGPWNIAVMFGLAVYGVSDAQGTAFSMLQWSGQTVMLIILGIYTMLYISLTKGKEQSPAAK